MNTRKLLVFLLCGLPLASQSPCVKQPGLAVELGVRRHFEQSFGGNRTLWASPAEDGKLEYVRVRIRLRDDESKDWLLHVRDEQFRLIQTFAAADFNVSRVRWTARVKGPALYLDIDKGPTGTSPAFVVEQYIAMFAGANVRYYSRQDDNDPKDLPLTKFAPTPGKPADIRKWGDALGILVASYTDAPAWTCSGVLIAENLFLTNWHCGGWAKVMRESDFWNKDIVSDAFVDLSWDGDAVGKEFTVSSVVDQDRELDFAVLRLLPLDKRGPTTVPYLRKRPPGNECIYLLHHPEGKLKHYSSCTIQDLGIAGWRSDRKIDFTHKCDSEGGSSGGPIFDHQGELVGLHHLGFTYKGENCESDKLNKAVRIADLLPRLEAVDEIKRSIKVSER